MKKFLIQSVALLILIFAGLLFYSGKVINLPFAPLPPTQPSSQKGVEINGNKIKVEIADTPAKRANGLGGRDNLASDSGMLFIFERQDKHSFWMKGLKFPLDFIWIKGDKIVDIILDAKPPIQGEKDENLAIYLPKEMVDKVLEVNTGMASRLNIKIGDIVRLE